MSTLLEAPQSPVFLLDLGQASERSPSQARNWLRVYLVVNKVPAETLGNALVVLSELVTNALRHVGGRVMCTAQIRESGVDLAVRDTGSLPPTVWAEHGQDDEHGRGLDLVRALSVDPCVSMLAGGGKQVTALIPYPTWTDPEVTP